MKPVLFAALALATGCTIPLVATSESAMRPTDSIQTIPHTLDDAEQLLIDKLGMRGFTLVERHETAAGAKLRFLGNRDFYGTSTIGSVFYAEVVPVSTVASRITLLGKPTVDHVESCPSIDGHDCQPLRVMPNWTVTGEEEANVIHGVFSELQLEAVLGSSEARCAAP